MEIDYKIKQELWILRQEFQIVDHERLYIKRGTNYEEYELKPIWKQKWIKEKKYLKEIILDENGLNYTFSDNIWLEEGEEADLHLYMHEVYIYENEKQADSKLEELNQ